MPFNGVFFVTLPPPPSNYEVGVFYPQFQDKDDEILKFQVNFEQIFFLPMIWF